MLNSYIEEVSNKYHFPICFHLNRVEMATTTAHQMFILNVLKPSEVPTYTRINYSFLQMTQSLEYKGVEYCPV